MAATYDLIICIDVLEHVAAYPVLLRALMERGRFLALTWPFRGEPPDPRYPQHLAMGEDPAEILRAGGWRPRAGTIVWEKGK